MFPPARRATLLPLLGLLVAAGCQNEKPAPSSPAPTQAPDEPARAKFVVADSTFSMGEADYGQTTTSSVRVANEGTAPLRVTLIERSCHCGEIEVPAREIPPGGDGKVVVKWTPTPGQTGTFTLAVKLGTNDPDVPQYRLELTGRVSPMVRILPEDRGFIDFKTIEPGKSLERELKVVSSRLKSFDLKASTTLAGLKTIVTKLTPDADVEDYLSGYLVRVRTDEGLPGGYLHDRLTLKIRAPEGESWTVTVPVYGDVENGIFQVRPREVAFQKKLVTEEDVKTVRVQFFVPSKEESLQVERCEPAFLVCDTPKQVKSGLWEFTVRLPPGNAAAAKHQPDGFFEGRIFLRTPQSKCAVPIRVKWNTSEAD